MLLTIFGSVKVIRERLPRPRHIPVKRGGIFVAYMWTVTVGFVVGLGLTGWAFVHFLKGALNSEDSVRIDPLPKEDQIT